MASSGESNAIGCQLGVVRQDHSGKSLTERVEQGEVLLISNGSLQPLPNPAGKDSLSTTSRAGDGEDLLLAAEELDEVALQPLTSVLGTAHAVADLAIE